jgi:hypothetical protein
MVWRWLSVVPFLVACSADVAPAISSTGPLASPSPVGPVASVPAASEGTVPPQPAELCFRVDAELEARFPAIRTIATEAAGRWGWTMRFAFECESRFGIGPTGAASAVHHPLVQDGDRWLTAAQGGASEIIVSDSAPLTEAGPDECVANWVDGTPMPAVLLRVITHELGHMLGLGEERENYDAAMFWSAMYCRDALPTEAELAASIRPHALGR